MSEATSVSLLVILVGSKLHLLSPRSSIPSLRSSSASHFLIPTPVDATNICFLGTTCPPECWTWNLTPASASNTSRGLRVPLTTITFLVPLSTSCLIPMLGVRQKKLSVLGIPCWLPLPLLPASRLAEYCGERSDEQRLLAARRRCGAFAVASLQPSSPPSPSSQVQPR